MVSACVYLFNFHFTSSLFGFSLFLLYAFTPCLFGMLIKIKKHIVVSEVTKLIISKLLPPLATFRFTIGLNKNIFKL